MDLEVTNCDLKIENGIFSRVFDDLEVTNCDLKIEIGIFSENFDVFEVAICDLKRKQVTRESHLLNKTELK